MNDCLKTVPLAVTAKVTGIEVSTLIKRLAKDHGTKPPTLPREAGEPYESDYQALIQWLQAEGYPQSRIDQIDVLMAEETIQE